MKRERLSNFELLRIIAMLLVVLTHCNLLVFNVTQTEVLYEPIVSFVRIFITQACAVCVPLFILLSGYFGIKAKFSGVLKILFQVFFYYALCIVAAGCLGWYIGWKTIIQCFLFGSSYWFVREYLILFILSPVLNSFMLNSTKGTQIKVLLGFFVLEFSLGWIVDYSSFNGGYSGISFVGLYLLGGFVRNNFEAIKKKTVWFDVSVYMLCTLIGSLIAYYGLKTINSNLGQFKYASPLVLLSSVFFFVSFLHFRIPDRYGRIINWFSISSFSIYLMTCNPILLPHIIDFLRQTYVNTTFVLYFSFVIVAILFTSTLCAVLDKIRLYLWGFVDKHLVGATNNRIDKGINSFYNSKRIK